MSEQGYRTVRYRNVITEEVRPLICGALYRVEDSNPQEYMGFSYEVVDRLHVGAKIFVFDDILSEWWPAVVVENSSGDPKRDRSLVVVQGRVIGWCTSAVPSGTCVFYSSKDGLTGRGKISRSPLAYNIADKIVGLPFIDVIFADETN